MLNFLMELLTKAKALFRHFTLEYTQPKLKLLTIDISSNIEECLVQFFDNHSKMDFFINLETLIKNKLLLENFSNIDAAEIGSSYGKILAHKHQQIVF